MASSTYEITTALKRMMLVLRTPKGIDFKDHTTMAEYSKALVVFNPDVLDEAVNRILDGRFERKYPDSFPRVTEMATFCRKVAAEFAKQQRKVEETKMAELRRVENAQHDEELRALRLDGEAQAYRLCLKTASDEGDLWLMAKLIRERCAETRRPIPHLKGRATNIAEDLELLTELPDYRKRRGRYADIPDAPKPEKQVGEAFGGL